MMGKTHILGGAVTLAGVALVTGQAAHYPWWAYGAAGIAALIPDADNHEGSMLNRATLLPFKALTIPLWQGAPHRGRTHSIVGTVAFAALMIFWLAVLNFILAANGAPDGVDPTVMIPALVAGYVSHLVLDLVNIPGEQLLWPLPTPKSSPRVYFPPWRAHGIMFLGRFATGTVHEAAVWIILVAFGGWFAVGQSAHIVSASTTDHSITQFFGGLYSLIINGIHTLVRALQ